MVNENLHFEKSKAYLFFNYNCIHRHYDTSNKKLKTVSPTIYTILSTSLRSFKHLWKLLSPPPPKPHPISTYNNGEREERGEEISVKKLICVAVRSSLRTLDCFSFGFTFRFYVNFTCFHGKICTRSELINYSDELR